MCMFLWVYLLLYFSPIIALYLEWLLALFWANMHKKKIGWTWHLLVSLIGTGVLLRICSPKASTYFSRMLSELLWEKSVWMDRRSWTHFKLWESFTANWWHQYSHHIRVHMKYEPGFILFISIFLTIIAPPPPPFSTPVPIIFHWYLPCLSRCVDLNFELVIQSSISVPQGTFQNHQLHGGDSTQSTLELAAPLVRQHQ